MNSRKLDESIQQWVDRVSIKDSQWLIKARKREKYALYYNIKFYLMLKYIRIKYKLKHLI